MDTGFAKPDLRFSFLEHGFLSIFLRSEYDQVETMPDLVEFIMKWINDLETTENPVRKNIVGKVVMPLYQMITGRSYQTKQFEEYSRETD